MNNIGKLFGIFVILVSFTSSLLATSDIKSRDEVVSAYIYLLSKNTTWPNEKDKKNFKIVIFEKDSSLYDTFKDITKDIKLKSKNIILKHATSIKYTDISDAQVVFLDKDFSQEIEDMKEKIDTKPILFITENASDIDNTMINLYENVKYKINIKINLQFIEQNRLRVNEKIILSGGSIISISKLYHSSIETIKKQEKKFELYKELNTKLKKNLKKYEKDIDKLKNNIAQKKEQYDKTIKLIAKKEKLIQQTQNKLDEKEQNIKLKESRISSLNHELTKQKKLLQTKLEELNKQQKDIKKYGDILNEKLLKIDNLDKKIKLQERSIQKNIQIAKQQKQKIQTQQYSIYLIGVIAILLMIFAIFLYINEKRYERLNKELELAKDEAIYANKSKSIFLANMSHELRTPLNAILGFSELLIDDERVLPEHKKTIKIINSSGSFLLSLINDILDISSIEARKITVEENLINVKIVLNEITSLLTNRAEAKSINLVSKFEGEIAECIKADSKKLRQILLNFITNSIKYSDKGTVTTTISMDHKHLYISVSDEGVGISPQDIEHIFEPFRQVGNASSATGTGLGLAITKQFVEIMGGTISVKSHINEGTEFLVELPYKKCLTSEHIEINNNFVSQKVIGITPKSKKLKVLIAEDKADNTLLLENILSILNFELKFVTNGKDAIDTFKEFKPDLIFMDKRMPKIDGISATKIIRNLPEAHDVIIVVVTANIFSQKNIQDAGFDDAVIKPYKPKTIYDIIKRYFDIEYIYKEQTNETDVQHIKISDDILKEKLLSLDTKTLDELFESTLLLNQEDMQDIMQTIQTIDTQLYSMLKQLIDEINFMQIIKVINAIKEGK